MKKNIQDEEDIFEEDLFDAFDENSIRDEKLEKREDKKEYFKKMGRKVFKVMAILIVFLFVGHSIYSSNKEDAIQKQEEKSVREEKEQKVILVKNDLLQQYGAIDFNEEDFLFSEDIQKESEKPLLLEGDVHDIFQKEGIKFIVLDEYNYRGIFEINDEHVNFIREKQEDALLNANFFFITKIENVSKLSLQTTYKKEGDDVWTYIEPSNDFFFTGKILDIKEYE